MNHPGVEFLNNYGSIIWNGWNGCIQSYSHMLIEYEFSMNIVKSSHWNVRMLEHVQDDCVYVGDTDRYRYNHKLRLYWDGFNPWIGFNQLVLDFSIEKNLKTRVLSSIDGRPLIYQPTMNCFPRKILAGKCHGTSTLKYEVNLATVALNRFWVSSPLFMTGRNILAVCTMCIVTHIYIYIYNVILCLYIYWYVNMYRWSRLLYRLLYRCW